MVETKVGPTIPSIDEGSGPSRRLQFAESYALVALTVAMCLFFCIWPKTSSTFPTAANAQAVLGNLALLGVASLAILIPLVCNQFDLSVGANLGLASVVAALVFTNGGSLLAAFVAAIASGAAVGIFNGVIVTRLRVNAVVATLGTALILAGIMTGKTSGQAIIPTLPAALVEFGSGQTLGIPNVFLVLVVLAGVVWYLLEQTPLGRYLYAIGSNEHAARLIGINTSRLAAVGFVLAGVLAGCGGLLVVVRTGSASPHIGETFTLPAFAAAFLSAASIRPGRFNMFGTLVAILFLAVLNSGLNLAGVPSYVGDVVNGTALISGVALAAYLGRQRQGTRA